MNERNFRLAIVGVGGVGGILAAPLIRAYGGAVSLVARGARGNHLRTQGLTLHSDLYGEFTVHPETVVETPQELGVQDFILVCVKNDALPTVVEQLRPIVGEHTLVIPVMNGVTAPQLLRERFEQDRVAASVIYTVSAANEDNSITQSGSFTHLFVDDLGGTPVSAQLAGIMQGAGIDWRPTADILTALWSKYVFNCAYNTMTAACATDAGHLKQEPLRSDFAAILTEAQQVGIRCGAALPADMTEKELHRLDKTTDASESSLSRDFAKKRIGEMEVFSGELVRQAERLGVEAPVTARYYRQLLTLAEAF